MEADRRMSKEPDCARCGQVITCVQCHSSLFGAADNILLCEKCSDHEEAEIDKHGTNDLPVLLGTYTADTVYWPNEGSLY